MFTLFVYLLAVVVNSLFWLSALSAAGITLNSSNTDATNLTIDTNGISGTTTTTSTSSVLSREFAVRLQLESAVQTIDDRFLSVTLDSSIMRHRWAHFDTSSDKLLSLAKGLSPVYLRVGGTSSDFLIFRETDNLDEKLDFLNNDSPDWEDLERPTTDKFNMTIFDWLYLNSFVQSVPGWQLLFDLNVLQRTDNRWDPTINATAILRMAKEKGYPLAGLELGNEPDAFRHLLGHAIDPTLLGSDFLRLCQLRKSTPFIKDSLIIGPDVTAQCMRKRRHIEFLKKFLQKAGKSMDAITVHHYYVNGRTATPDQFMDPDILNTFSTELDVALNLLSVYSPGKHLWLGETSSAFGGGALGLSDTYIAGFMWLDKLGISARRGVKVVMRQSFYKGHYALIDFRTLDPKPDYWLSLLFKRLVGNLVLDARIDDTEDKLRVYAHCTKQDRMAGATAAASVTVYAMNLHEDDVVVKFPQFSADQELHVYLLEPQGSSGVLSGAVTLNGRILQLNDAEKLPPIEPRIQHSSSVSFPAKTFGFIVIPDIESPACSTASLYQKMTVTAETKTTLRRLSWFEWLEAIYHVFKCLFIKYFYI